MLENFGFRVIDERTYTSQADATAREFFLHDMVIDAARGRRRSISTALGPKVEAAILAVWAGAPESDGFNQLTLAARLVLVRRHDPPRAEPLPAPDRGLATRRPTSRRC